MVNVASKQVLPSIKDGHTVIYSKLNNAVCKQVKHIPHWMQLVCAVMLVTRTSVESVVELALVMMLLEGVVRYDSKTMTQIYHEMLSCQVFL